jgi:hypothetical protein
MAKRKQATRATLPYLRRIAEDESAQNHFADAFTQLREVYSRSRREGIKATEDKKLYAKVRQAATSIRRGVSAVEEPPQPKWRERKLLLLLLPAIALGAFATRRALASKGADAEDGTAWPQTQQPPVPETFGAPADAAPPPIPASG